jgi:hypothetical protein
MRDRSVKNKPLILPQRAAKKAILGSTLSHNSAPAVRMSVAGMAQNLFN